MSEVVRYDDVRVFPQAALAIEVVVVSNYQRHVAYIQRASKRRLRCRLWAGGGVSAEVNLHMNRLVRHDAQQRRVGFLAHGFRLDVRHIGRRFRQKCLHECGHRDWDA